MAAIEVGWGACLYNGIPQAGAIEVHAELLGAGEFIDFTNGLIWPAGASTSVHGVFKTYQAGGGEVGVVGIDI